MIVGALTGSNNIYSKVGVLGICGTAHPPQIMDVNPQRSLLPAAGAHFVHQALDLIGIEVRSDGLSRFVVRGENTEVCEDFFSL